MKIIAIIPARGGSKGIPKKNIRPFKGSPLVSWSIRAALATRRVDRVIVSSDSDEIGQIGQEYGAQFVRRPEELASDTASSESALLHVLGYLEETEAFTPDFVVFLQCTSPFVVTADIDQALEVVVTGNYDSLFSAYCSHFQGRWQMKDHAIAPMNYDPGKRPTRQQYPREYFENGAIYVFRPEILRKTGSRLGGHIAVLEMSPYRSFQIDSEEDWSFLEGLPIAGADGAVAAMVRKIRLLVLDFDGVFTDNRVLVMEDGREGVLCNRGDSLRLAELRDMGIEVVVLSTEANRVVSARCEKLGIPVFQGIRDKADSLCRLKDEKGLAWTEIAYVGNDVNDLGCMEKVGLPIAVRDAVPEILKASSYITRKNGGEGAVREVVGLLVNQGNGVSP